ncbi:MIP/aquaporin family protein [Pelosinus sp. HCF1]|uniref:MIP/aquaporin family protein n=1 Tax=Pelosinus sp. HCF1 TaxID=1235479 RepID=UPI0002E0FABA|nr:MIP/aquaporin family protein [Pelosinus sp. HCF1]
MMSTLFGEFFGMMVFIAFGCSVVANVLLKNSKGEGSGCIVIYTGWAMAILMGVTAGLATGNSADLSPAVTLVKLLMGVTGYTVSNAVAMMGAQVLGGAAGATLAWLIYLPHFEATEDKGLKLAVFSTGPAIRKTSANFLCEALSTALLIVIIFSLGHKNVAGTSGMASGFGAYMVGMVVWAVGLCFGGPTGYALNPARDLGPRIAHAILPIAGKGGSDWSYSWIPVVAPMVGASIAFVVCRAVGIV